MNIVVCNTYSWLNKGDSAIVLVLIETLRKVAPRSDITLISCTPRIDKIAYKEYGVQVAGGPVDLEDSHARTRKAFSTLCLFALLLFFCRLRIGFRIVGRLSSRAGPILESFSKADVVVSCGGGFLNSNAGPSVYGHVTQLLLAALLGKPTVMYAQSIGPFRGIILPRLCRFVLNRASLIILREELSLEWIRRIGVSNPNVRVTTDLAFLLSPRRSANIHPVRNGSDSLLGITVRHWTFPESGESDTLLQRYFNSVASLVRHLTNKNVHVFFFPQVTIPLVDDDRLASSVVLRLAHVQNGVEMIDEELAPDELQEIIGHMDFFVGTRMHSNIFALSQGVPTLAIGYEFKTRGLMSQLRSERWTIDIGQIDPESLIAKVDELLSSTTHYRSSLQLGLDNVRKRARENELLLKRFIRTTVEKKQRSEV